jgi:hypothetical protein
MSTSVSKRSVSKRGCIHTIIIPKKILSVFRFVANPGYDACSVMQNELPESLTLSGFQTL